MRFAGYAEPQTRPPFRSYAALTAIFNAGFAGAMLATRRSGRLPDAVAAQDVVLIGTASHKLARLVSKDKVTSFLRAPFTECQGRRARRSRRASARRGRPQSRRRAPDLPLLPRTVGVGRFPRRPGVRATRHPGRSVHADGADDVGLPPDRLQGGGGPRPRRGVTPPSAGGDAGDTAGARLRRRPLHRQTSPPRPGPA
jgi:Protein of unknown function (DUF1360)